MMAKERTLFRIIIGFTLLAIISTVVSCNRTPKVPWMELFNGEDLSGWEIVDGQAEPKVVEGVITVEQVDTANFVYLLHTEILSDFILELDAKLTGELNSGILIRGIRDPLKNKGLTHGFQMEIDQSERKWTGGIYEEQGRLWLTPLDGIPEAMEAYRVSDWNHYRVEAIRDTFKIWVNEVPTTYLIDGKTKEGLIGFQIHKLSPEMEKGMLQLKNIRIITDRPQRFSRTISFPLVNTGQ
jgi:hypothetical protein